MFFKKFSMLLHYFFSVKYFSIKKLKHKKTNFKNRFTFCYFINIRGTRKFFSFFKWRKKCFDGNSTAILNART